MEGESRRDDIGPGRSQEAKNLVSKDGYVIDGHHTWPQQSDEMLAVRQ
jgi:hypothetical protein